MNHGYTHYDPDNCFGCKVKTVQLRPSTAFQPHFNYSVGEYVETEEQFRSSLRRRADENSIATGTDHNYEMRDPGEMRSSGVPYPEADGILDTQGSEMVKKYAQ